MQDVWSRLNPSCVCFIRIVQVSTHLYAERMEWSLRELRCFTVAAELGTLTGAAEHLHVSQAAVSRAIASFELALGQRVLHRGRNGCELTSFGEALLPQARRVLASAEQLNTLARAQQGQLTLGYAWAALGKHTTALQRGWAKTHPETELKLIRHTSPTSGLAEGRCDAAIMRVTPDPTKFASAVVGLERRLAAFSSDDPQWARRRSLRMRDFASRTVLADSRTGTTSSALWSGVHAPERFIESADLDDWLNGIATGIGVGTTAEATAAQHARPGVTFLPITDAPRIPVHIAWWNSDPPAKISELIEAVTRLYHAQ